ncbi:MAG: DM13 domain-containing protein [Acidimicrobiia bacterium]
MRSHRGLAVAAAVTTLAIMAVALWWFEPHKLFIDERVDEALPTAVATVPPSTTTVTTSVAPLPVTTGVAPPSSGTAPLTTTAPPEPTTTVPPPTTAAPGPVTLSDTQMTGVGRSGSGRVLVLDLGDGSRLVRFEDLDVTNGPDLVVILSPSPLVDDREVYDDGEFLVLGDLKGNQGNQNYDIPPEVDLDRYGSIAIWCRRFNYTFTAAALDLASS